MRIRVGSVLVFLFLATLVVATGLCGAYERIYYWHAYNILMDENPGQKIILPFLEQKGDEWRNNKGSGPGGRLTWYEFMDRFDNKNQGNCKIDPPGEGRDIHQVAAELQKAGYNSALNIRMLSGKQSGKDKFGEYCVKVTKAVAHARANGDKGESGSINGNDYRQWDYIDHVDKMRQCITVITDIRRWEWNGKYMKWALAESFNLWQNADKSILKEDRTYIDGVVFDDLVRPQYSEGPDLRAINVVETLRSSAVQANIKAKIEKPNDRKKWRSILRDWISGCGTFEGKKPCNAKGTPDFPEYTKGHKEALGGTQEAAQVIAKDAGC